MSASPQKPICVVIDTNIWRSDLLLKDAIGMSFVYTLGRQRGFIGLPEVVEGELKNQIVECGCKAIAKLEEPSRTLETLTGSPVVVALPTKRKLEEVVDARIAELRPILKPVPFTFEHARAALAMLYAHVPPNGENDE